MVTLPFILLGILTCRAIYSLPFFRPKSTSVNRVFQDRRAEEERLRTISQQYADAGIPYIDAQERFVIIFTTSYPSDDITVVIQTQNDYDNIRKEADKIIQEAREKVQINKFRYLDSY